jgi:ribonuclease PH
MMETPGGTLVTRIDGRGYEELRPVKITRHYIKNADGSVLIETGDTKVICTATLDDRTAPFLKGTGRGWVTAEYGMLPRSTPERNQREAARGKQGGRTLEIQRLIGRALRSVTDLPALGERAVLIDCDVIQADGGTRTASITGSFVALIDALNKWRMAQVIASIPVREFLAATSVGVVEGVPCLDLCYAEDSTAKVDMNLVMTSSGKIVEIQGTGEESPFSFDELEAMLELGKKGTAQLIGYQKQALGELAAEVGRRGETSGTGN